jgi:hypothetical protein
MEKSSVGGDDRSSRIWRTGVDGKRQAGEERT